MSTAAERYAAWREGRNWAFLRRINFEISAVCNLRCAYCTLPRGPRPAVPFMPPALLERVLREVGASPARLADIGLYFTGESLLHPDFLGLLDLTRDTLATAFTYRPTVYMHTNGTRWRPDLARAILDRGVLQRIIWSIDGVDRESFERMRPGARYDEVLTNCERVLDLRGREPAPAIWINNMVDRECAGRPRAERLAALFARADNVRTFYPYDLNEGDRHGYYRYPRPETGFCCYSLDTIIVTADARLSLCCVDIGKLNAFGDLTAHSFADEYFGAVHRQRLRWMSQGERARIPGCARCQVGEGVDNFPFGTPVESAAVMPT
jgi:hypothetical protein